MKIKVILSFIVILFAIACGEKTTIKFSEESCDIDLNSLDGVWVMEKPDPEKGYVLDHQFRLKFYKENGVEKVINTAGSYNKYTYTIDTANSTPTRKIFMEDIEWPAEKVEEFKKTNKTWGTKLQGKLYIEVNKKMCRLQVSDHFITYIYGQLMEDSNIGGTGLFRRYDEKPLSFVHCKNTEGMKVYDGKGGKLKIKESLDAINTTFETNRSVYFEISTNKKDDGPDECSYTFDTYHQNFLDKTGLIPEEKGRKRIWGFEQTFSEEGSHFIEMYRYRDCGGRKELIEVACTKVIVK